jgi:pimeloyl-ACP methyl ester carboxylesterase
VEQIGDEIAMMGERAGLAAEALATLDAVHRAAVHWTRSGEGWDDYAAVLAAAKTGPLRDSEVARGFPTEREDPAWTFARAVGDFDPMEHWRALRVPVLFVYGGRDTQVRTAKSVARIQQELAPLGVDAGVLWFAGNGHALFRADALDFLASWIRARGEG